MPTNKLVLKITLQIAVLLCFANEALADSWLFPAKSEDTIFTFGETKIVLTVDGRRDRRSPDFILQVYDKGQLQSRIPGVWFKQVFPSPDKSFFVGLSNSGIPGTAVIVFTRRGEVSLLASHRLAEFDYCDKSVTVERHWYDESNPDVKFLSPEAANNKSGITLRDCHGKTVDLLDVVLKAYDTTRQSLPHADVASPP